MIADLPGRDSERDQTTQPVGYAMDFGARSAARASEGLRPRPPLWNGPPLSFTLIGQAEG